MANYVLKNCQMIDGKNHGLQEDMTILVSNGKILKIEKSSKLTIPQGYQFIDLSGKYVMPGLINAHVHLFGSGKPMKAMSGGEASKKLIHRLNTNLGKKLLDKMVLNHIQAQFNSGVTTVRAVGDLLYSDIKLRNKIENGQVTGPRLIVSGPAVSVTGGHGAGTFANISDSPWEARKLVRENVHEQVDLIKICVTGGVTDSRKVGEAGLLKMTLEEVKAACEEAHKIGFLVAAHAESTEGVRTALLGGVDTIEHGSAFDQEIINLFLHNPNSLRGYSSLIPTLYPAITIYKIDPQITLMNSVVVENSRIVFEGMVKGMQQAMEAGIMVGLGTDASCPFVTQYNTWRELDYTVRYAGISPEAAIHNATRVNAKILGIDKETGTLEEGKTSDLIVLQNNPLDDLRTLSDVLMVMHGNILIEKLNVKKLAQIEQVLDSIN